MDDNSELSFNSAEEEAKYWRKRYFEVKEDLEEFQVNSRELEAELEAQLEQVEQQNKELNARSSRLQIDCETLREKLENVQNDSHRTIGDLQEELVQIKSHNDELTKYIRDLEQTNDDLERTKRAAVVSVEDFEQKLNQAIERNAFLESELDDKEAMAISLQRLKDESRDLRHELQIRNRQPLLSNAPDNDRCYEKIISSIDSNKLTSEIETQTIPGSPIRCSNNQLCPATALTPSARISALNIVGDLLRKVGALESKLASCRNFVKENPRPHQGKSTPHNSPRPRRLNRGVSAGNIHMKINL